MHYDRLKEGVTKGYIFFKTAETRRRGEHINIAYFFASLSLCGQNETFKEPHSFHYLINLLP